jgi:internalin A
MSLQTCSRRRRVPKLSIAFRRAVESNSHARNKSHYDGWTMADFLEEVRLRIDAARREGQKLLDLSWSHLNEIPDELFELTHLEGLYLRGNNIRYVPERLRELPNLRRIELGENPIRSVPDLPGLALDWEAYLWCRPVITKANVVGLNVVTGQSHDSATDGLPVDLLEQLRALPSLRMLSLGPNRVLPRSERPDATPPIASVVKGLGELTGVEELTLFGFRLHEVPTGLRQLKKLHFLSISAAGLLSIPDWIGELKELEYLWLSENKLKTLPETLSKLRLHTFEISGNVFEEIPDIVFRMSSLVQLAVSDNPGIREISAQILDLPNLRVLEAKNCPIESPPPEIVAKRVDAIKEYWRQQQEQGTDYLCEAKLLIIGEAGAGKTSLAQKIKDPAYQLQPSEPSTEGIEVTPYTFAAAVRVQDGAIEKTLQRDFRVNMWDFGGQEIYQATHQFFLTRRSLYALVTDDRKEDTDFNYWLHVVELLSDGSPLIIIQNEKQERYRDINLGSFRARFANLKEAYRVDLATNRGLDDLIRAIRHESEGLPHIGTPLPRAWKLVREALESDSRNHIPLDDYFEICRLRGFTRHKDSLQLSGYLHDLGICLHFQDDPVLHKTVILKPKWGTDAAYRVLDDRTVLENQGRITPIDLVRIWSDEHYASMQHELLQLMKKFQLCYELPEGRAYIAPQLLSSAQPEYKWEPFGNLVLRYQYDFMPKGLLTRLIVALNHLIEEHRAVWKTGMVLQRQGTRAEVIEDYARRKITVRLAGRDTRGLLAIIDNQLDLIHAPFVKLKYDKYLPCNCEKCRSLPDPYAFSLSELEDFAKTGDEIQCRIGRKMVDAAKLIANVLPSASLRARLREYTLHPESVPAPAKEVFISYDRTNDPIVDRIETAAKQRDITLLRDRNELRYKDGIRAFMQRIGRGNCIVAVISKRYLESKYCMFELTEIVAHGAFRDRIFPVILDDANIFDAEGRLPYIKHWEKKKKDLTKAMKGVDPANLQGIREEIDDVTKFRATIAGIVDTLADMNSLSPVQHQGTNFEALLDALAERLNQ